MRQLNLLVLTAGDGVHQPLPRTRVAPVDRRVLVRRKRHIEIKGKPQQHQQIGGTNCFSVRQEKPENRNQHRIGAPEPERSMIPSEIPGPLRRTKFIDRNHQNVKEPHNNEISRQFQIAQHHAQADSQPHKQQGLMIGKAQTENEGGNK